jgi:hypothetical protein
VDKLDRLKRELLETESLLNSPRVKDMTRTVLERLSDDLRKQIATFQTEESSRTVKGSSKAQPDHENGKPI